MAPVRMDLHIHTCLSPCGAPEMVPTRIISRAVELHLGAIGICDHNSSENVESVKKAARTKDIHVFGGMEITSREEIHVLALFNSSEQLEEMQKRVYAALPGKNNSTFGEQYIVDPDDYVVSINERLLIGATDLSIEEIVSSIHRFQGIAIASHVDRPSYSIISQLGIIPPDLDLDALEISDERGGPYYVETGIPAVGFSDAHTLGDIGRTTTCFEIERVSIEEIGMALRSLAGRGIGSVDYWG